MNPTRDITQDLQDWLHEPDRLPPPRISEVAPLVHRTPQHGGLVPPLPRRFAIMFNASGYVVAAVTLALLSGLLLTGILAPRSTDDEALVGASATASTEPNDVEPTSDLVAGPGPWLVWEETTIEERSGGPGNFDPRMRALQDAGHDTKDVEAWGRPNDYVLAARPGAMSRSDKQGILDGYRPLDLFVIRPDFSVESHRMDKPYDIVVIAVGPKGILIQTRVDGSGFRQMAIAGRSTGQRDEDCCQVLDDGTVTTDGSDGLPRTIAFSAWRDRLERVGLDRSDIAQQQRYWLWQDGAGWSEVDKPPAGERQAGATDDGFYQHSGHGRIHFSPDGREWRVLDGAVPATDDKGDWALVERVGGLILTTGNDFAVVEPAGIRPTPFADIPAPDDESLALVEAYAWHESEPLPVFLPDIGPVYIHDQSGTATLGRDEDHWGTAPVPGPDRSYWADPDPRLDLWDFEVVDGELIFQPGWSPETYRAVVTDEPPSQPTQPLE